MPHAMFKNTRKRPYRVAIEGFSEFERAALGSFFRLAERRVPAYVQVDSPDASDFLIADADQPRVLHSIARERRARDTVFVGSQAPNDAVAWLTRPIEPVHIMRALDGLLGERLSHEVPTLDEPVDALPPLPSSPETVPPPKRRPNPAAHAGSGGDRPALVVDDSAVARAFLAQRLRQLGFRVTLAPTGEEALAVAAERAFNLVFLDIDLGGNDRLDGLQVCQTLKQRASHPDGIVPAVVITTASQGATDRVRGSLAGCDAYLTKPLMEADFTAALRHVDPLFK